MGIKTDLYASPYHNDYDETKNYHQILFKPSVPVQARELNQLQTILQQQIERFGDNILEKGTVVKGGNFFDLKKLPYIKITDLTSSNEVVKVENYIKAYLTGINSGVKAKVMTYIDGSVNTSPNLNTLYLKYTESGIGTDGKDIKTFIPGEQLEVSIDGVIYPELSIFVASNSIDSSPIGHGYAVKCGDGVIYQKGCFINFEEQIILVSKYDTTPDNVVVGFVTKETIITADDDSTLYNNSEGFYNTNVVGADRLKLTPVLTVYTKSEAEDDEDFFAIQEYQNGNLVRKNTTTQFNSFNKELEKRTDEESGDYIVKGFNIHCYESAKNQNYSMIDVSAGVGYVNGKRVETVGPYTFMIEPTIATELAEDQDILANYGNMIYVDNMIGSFPYETMGVVSLYNAEQVATSLVGLTPVGTKIGSARVISYDKEYNNRYRLYLFDVKMDSGYSFSGVKSIISTGCGFGNVVLTSGKAVLKDTQFKSLIFPLSHSSVQKVIISNTDYVFRKKQNMNVGVSGTILVSLGGDEAFPYTPGSYLSSDSLKDIHVTNTNSGAVYNVISAYVDGSGSSMTVELGALGSTTPVTFVCNIKKINAKPSGKKLKTVYMKINANNYVSKTYSLGWPDVHSIEGIWKGSNTTFTESSNNIYDVTDNFKLVKNDNGMYYDLSYIKLKNNMRISNSDVFLVKAKTFVKETTGSFADSYFSINSYPVDDTSTTLPSNKIRTYEIPSTLRGGIDFRQYATNQALYAETPSSASIATSTNKLNSLSFDTNSVLPSPNRSFETSYTYYLGRRDLIIINKSGDIVIKEGVPSNNPTYPIVAKSSLVIGELYIPPYPALAPTFANKIGNLGYSIQLNKKNNRRYTMKDISSIEKRIDNIEYYTVLSALEKSAEDMVIQDANGLNRFKNGIYVDNFKNMLLCDVKNTDFKASVDPGESLLYPSFRSYNLEMRLPSVDGGMQIIDRKTALMSYESVLMDSQPYATKYRNCVTDFYTFSGIGEIYPEYDNGYTETTAPTVNITVDLDSAFTEYTEALGELVPLTYSNSSVVVSSTSNTLVTNTATTSTRSVTNTTTTTTTTSTTSLVNLGANTTTTRVGDFISNVSISPYLREGVIRAVVSGLKPNTRFWSWFDGVEVTNKCIMAEYSANSTEVEDLRRKSHSPYGLLRSDTSGVLKFMFNIPSNTFYVGDRILMIADVDSENSLDSATSTASMSYNGFNYNVERTGLEVSTRMPNYDVVTSRSVNTVVTSVTSNTTTPIWTWVNSGGEGSRDPISQTFYVDKSYSNNDNLMITKVEVAFKSKSATKGVTLQIRKTVNGYPSSEALAFGSVNLTPDQVRISNDASLYTEFKFKSPVTLATGESYAIVIIPHGNSPDYKVFVAKTGETDIKSGLNIVSDVHNGTLFTSTNNSAWTPYQSENMTFKIYKASITSSEGSVTLKPNNYEFLNLDSFQGTFSRGETAFVLKSNAVGSITTTEGSDVVVGVGTTFTSTFAIGDWISIYNQNTSKYEVAKIISISSNTSMTISQIMSSSLSGRTYFKTIVGVVDYFNKKSPMRLILKESSATSSMLFVAGSTIIGESSNATATVSEVTNLKVSHYQSNIIKTVLNKTDVKLYRTIETDIDGNRSFVNINQNFGSNNRLSAKPTVIMSKSNEISTFGYNSGKSFALKVDVKLLGEGPYNITPVIDYSISSILAFEYMVSEDTTEIMESELFDGGLASAKYITKTIELRDGFDAEDFKVWVTGYRPPNTNISVFVKFINDIDQTDTPLMSWTKLQLVDKNNVLCSASNINDFKEYEYGLSSTVLGNNGGAYLNGGTDFMYKGIDGQVYDNFKKFIIKIVLSSNSHNKIPKIMDVRAIALT